MVPTTSCPTQVNVGSLISGILEMDISTETRQHLVMAGSTPDFECTVRIHAIFGSDIQCDVSMRVLNEFLEAWRHNVETAHKKNKVTISCGEETEGHVNS